MTNIMRAYRDVLRAARDSTTLLTTFGGLTQVTIIDDVERALGYSVQYSAVCAVHTFLRCWVQVVGTGQAVPCLDLISSHG